MMGSSPGLSHVALMIVRSCLGGKILSSFSLCLFLRIAKEANTADVYYEPGKVTKQKNIPAKPIVTESCRELQYCDDYNIYADVGSLPPCFCDTNEGL